MQLPYIITSICLVAVASQTNFLLNFSSKLLARIYPAMSPTADSLWPSQHVGWHSRANAHSSPSKFTPTRQDLALAILLNSQGIHQGFTLALFKPNIAVDAMGRIIVVPEQDFDHMVALAHKTPELPQTGGFRNTWRVHNEATGKPIHRLLVPTAEGKLVETSIYGYRKDSKKLSTPVEGSDELPDVLGEFFGLALEAEEDYEFLKEDEAVVNKVKAILGEV